MDCVVTRESHRLVAGAWWPWRLAPRAGGARPGAGAYVGGGLAAWLVGLAAATRHARLVLAVWLVLLGVSLLAVWPVWRWLSGTLALAPAGDALLHDLDLPLLKDLGQGDPAAVAQLAGGWMPYALVSALIVNPFLAGGILATLTQSSTHAVPSRLVAGGVRYFWRCFFSIIPVGLLALLLVPAVAGIGNGLSFAAAARGLERLSLIAAGLTALAGAVAVGFCLLVLDITRVRLVRDDGWSVWAEFRGAMRLVVRHGLAFMTLGLVSAFLILAVVAAGVALIALLPQTTWPLIVLGFVVHQLVALIRTWLRVGLLGGEVVLVDWREPRPATPTAAPPSEDVSFPDQPVVSEYVPDLERPPY
jgi:hypothetical protein